MSDQFVGEIRLFPFNFAPRGWAICAGQLMPISQNTALFSLIGTYYGGDGRATFALPNLGGAMAMHAGHGPGLTLRTVGESGGEQNVTLLTTDLPTHTHTAMASSAAGDQASPIGNYWASPGAARGLRAYDPASGTATTMSQLAISPNVGGLPHNNMQPYQVLSYCIALQGIFPARN